MNILGQITKCLEGQEIESQSSREGYPEHRVLAVIKPIGRGDWKRLKLETGGRNRKTGKVETTYEVQTSVV